MLDEVEATDQRAAEEVRELRRYQRSREELDRIACGVRPFSYAELEASVPPATPEELEGWEEFLRQRDAEREASMSREAGLAPDTEVPR